MLGGPEPFALSASATGSALIARLSGDLDLSTANVANQALLEAAAALPLSDLIVLDLTAITFFGASAVHALRDFATTCVQCGISVRLVIEPGSIVRRVASLGSLDARIPTFPTLAEAL